MEKFADADVITPTIPFFCHLFLLHQVINQYPPGSVFCHQVANLRKEREMMITRQQADYGGDAQRIRLLQRENAQLHLKVKGLLTELEEIRSQREHLGLQSDNVSRLQSKQLAEHAANVKSLEVTLI